jgi:hypothetical protein
MMNTSCCAQVCVRALRGESGYLVSIITDTSTLARNLNRQNKQYLMVGIPEDTYNAYDISI